LASPLSRQVTVLIPVYGAPDHLRACLESLAHFLPTGVPVHVLDDATPSDAIPQAVAPFLKRIPSLRYVRRDENLGFVENCNEGMRAVIDAADDGEESDILLLNSDTEITAGSIEEMSAVLHLHEKHGAVCPRSNNATIFSLPLYEKLAPGDSYKLWQSLRSKLTRYQIMPTCVGFCMLIRHEVLRYFGYFDPIYSPGYNEENDLVCRMNRHGYSAVAANQAFVFHHEGASFGSQRPSLEKRNRRILEERYPEYPRMVAEYFRYQRDPVERFGSLCLNPRKKILIDLYHITPHHSGTSEFALNLLLHLAPLLERRYDLTIGTNAEARAFLEVELAGYPFFDEQRTPEGVFDLVFKPCQLFFWSELHRIARLGARICCVHQDSIAVRCRYLCAISAELLQRSVPALFDKVIAISKFSHTDYNILHGAPAEFDVIYQGSENSIQTRGESRNILVIGSKMQHKGVDSAVRAVLGVAPIVVLGGEPGPFKPDEVHWHRSGHLGKTEIAGLYADAAIVIYPSYYEGFGLPVLDGLSAGCDVIVLDSAVNQELKELTGNPRLHFARSHREMRKLAQQLMEDGQPREVVPQRSWADVAREYEAALDELLDREIDVDRLRYRWHWLSTIDSIANIS
jgi:GT2 family glycosyltransferase/glycosyltransferase involved in cell wall biosynthesis